MEQLDSQQEVQGASQPKKSALREMLESIVIAVLLAAVIRLFILEPFYIPSGSMEPTLLIGDRIIVSKITYHLREPQPGDIVVFKFPLDPSRNFVKRLIARGGDTVEIKDSVLYINGKPVPEPYLPKDLTFQDFGPQTVPPGHYFMMGDNRNNSDDSRVWGFLARDLIVGKAEVIYWPLNRISLVK
ncbi:signal peptidase I [Desulforamulus hydrothermalis]|uniref:Signal peptidase I n=1 Tax=Desulforamulus hydrothermalis Lam5 = DSM 18033 TaxID=1121428 RepID=K8DZH1_9FIRM|nr:signal peptidase I [Desulforamulus hydrothermalis]CCO08474.1 putative signal peptidase I-2 [Desulforamulus hydrothermalis Lam5 = DSM 18033]SHH29163.1 signal peptidase I . Serine peptidase. MEROPS family S26A [Desulforamulus hydrothermalis Lam5 = DSM 18033]